MAALPFTIRSCTSVSEFRQMEDLQQRVWGFTERDLVPSQMFVVAAKTGGQVLGAFVEGQMAGFVLACPGIRNGRAYLHSHMAAVLPEFRDRGLGRELKLAQRADALERGIELIEWTFDPLQTKNAYFNFCRLGVIARRYLLDLYGATSSPLHAGLPTDRLLVEWHVASPRVARILGGSKASVGADAARVEVVLPANDAPPARMAAVQTQIRERFQSLFAAGHVATWFEPVEGGGAYILEREAEERFEFRA